MANLKDSYKITVRTGRGKQRIEFFKTKKAAKKFIKGASELAKDFRGEANIKVRPPKGKKISKDLKKLIG